MSLSIRKKGRRKIKCKYNLIFRRLETETHERRKRLVLNIDMRQTLDKQVDEKNKSMEIRREEDKKYKNFIREVEDAYYSEEENKK
jgi:phage regulator Rha-like protein